MSCTLGYFKVCSISSIRRLQALTRCLPHFSKCSVCAIPNGQRRRGATMIRSPTSTLSGPCSCSLPFRCHSHMPISIPMPHKHTMFRWRRSLPFLQHPQVPTGDGEPLLRWVEGIHVSEDEKLEAVHALLQNDFNKMTPMDFVLQLLGHSGEFKSIKDGFYASQAIPNFLNVISNDCRLLKQFERGDGKDIFRIDELREQHGEHFPRPRCGSNSTVPAS